jgi:DedD protein
MGLFSFLSKNKQETAKGADEFYSRAEEETQAARGRKRKSAKAGNASLDPVLPEKKRARRRLVGAIALVLAMIIGLPMILDSEPKPVSDDISIQIPSRDKVTTPTLTPSASAASAAASSAASAPVASAPAASVPLAASLSQHEQVLDLPKPNSVASMPSAATPVKMPASTNSMTSTVTAPKPTPHEEVKQKESMHEVVEAKTQSKPERAAERHDDARAEAILEGKDTDSGKSADKKPTKFVVQVAALTSQDKVAELQGKLTDAGFKSYLQRVPTETGERIRVRIGPFSSKDEAENTRTKLSKLGLSSKLMPS